MLVYRYNGPRMLLHPLCPRFSPVFTSFSTPCRAKGKKITSAPWTIANSTTRRTAGTQGLRPTLGPRLGKVCEEFIRLRVTRRAGPAGRFDRNMHVS